MSLGALSFLSPWPLLGLLALPVIWWLLRSTPPSPVLQSFPPTRILRNLLQKESTPAHSPWWLTLLRLLLAALVILALAQPVLNSSDSLLSRDTGDRSARGPLLVVVDNGWRAADRWKARKVMLQRLFREAQAQERLIYLVSTAPQSAGSQVQILSATEGFSLLERYEPTAFSTDRLTAFKTLDKALNEAQTGAASGDGGTLFFLTDGLTVGDETALGDVFEAFKKRGFELNIITPTKDQLAFGLSSKLGPGGVLYGIVEAAPLERARQGFVLALSARDEVLGRTPFQLKPGARRAEAKIDLPLELRNQIAKLKIDGTRSAGSIHLIDQRSHWRRVGLISNERGQLAQPLLSPLYYIQRALEPYAEIVSSGSDDVAQTVEKFTERNVSVIVMADVGRLIGAPLLSLVDWVEAGGVLVRFAGPHIEKSQDSLLPTPLRQGGRRLGGALSWSEPQKLAAFDEKSPFAGLEVPDDVLVRRQLLADPSRLSDDVYIWARLKDGTPLVTASKEVNGWVVLMHVTANSDWSSLPLSGLFVDMLRRLTQLSISPVGQSNETETRLSDTEKEAVIQQTEESLTLLSPYLVLDGFGTLRKPRAMVEPLAFSKIKETNIDAVHPPGFYGPAGQSVALNLFPKAGPLSTLDLTQVAGNRYDYSNAPERALRGPFFLIALLLLLLDSLIILWMRGGFNFSRVKQVSAVFLLIASLGLLPGLVLNVTPAFAQEGTKAENEMKAALNTHLAYVITGDAKIDKTSRDGLKGLSYILNSRTAVEPAEPLAVDILRDELAFYPILYWPVGLYTKPISAEGAQRVNAYMKQGGMIIFDTKDQNSRVGGLKGEGQAALETLLSKLDIPRLEPVPKGHVLSKSFYLLSQFPGRYQGGELWVEATTKSRSDRSSDVSEIDGVSTILITSNDFSSAWAVNDNLQPLYPVVPGDRLQREMAYRVGVNIVMYALAGNYKADQVHVPALLERLGQ